MKDIKGIPPHDAYPCSCGRSPTGRCCGWHSLTEEEYLDKAHPHTLNYHHLTALGDYYPTSYKLLETEESVDTTEEKFEYVRYNPRTNIDRWGLSLTSLDGGVTGIPDLDSIKQYNTEHNTTYIEDDFNVPTPAYHYFKPVLNLFKPWLFRTHILKLNPGGYFPPHRDAITLKSFRLIIALKNTKSPAVQFLIEDRVLHFEEGRLYFVDTVKEHQLFNSSNDPSYWLVMNVKVTKEAVATLLNLIQKEYK